MPGAPAIIKEQMAKQFASAGATETCVTQEQIDQEDVADAMSKSYGEGCTWAKNNIGGGSIDVAGTCTAHGQKLDLAMTGLMAPKTTEVTNTTQMTAPTGGQLALPKQELRKAPCVDIECPTVETPQGTQAPTTTKTN